MWILNAFTENFLNKRGDVGCQMVTNPVDFEQLIM